MVKGHGLTGEIVLKIDIAMEQRTIWIPFLIIGISLTSIIFKPCGDNEIVEPIKTVQYVYKNQTDNNLVMEIYSQTNTLIDSYHIAPNSQIISNTTKVKDQLFSIMNKTKKA